MTEVLHVDAEHPDPTSIARAGACLSSGGLVAFPTETVYGLGAHALDRAAIRRLFAAKQRPATDPLIVHIASIERATALVAGIPETARTLARHFWPGPLTLVLPRSAQVPDVVTAGLNTVAIRVPSHPVARALIEAARVPVAAPSANLFSRPSPTCAAHVLADLNGRIDMVLDAGPTYVGVESTVVDLSGPIATLLRPGAIDADALRVFLPDLRIDARNSRPGSAMASPGMLDKHYSPRTPLLLYTGGRNTALRAIAVEARRRANERERVIVLAYAEDLDELRGIPADVVELGTEATPTTVAARLYAALRESDEAAASVILVRSLNSLHPLSAAINDRLRRAAAR